MVVKAYAKLNLVLNVTKNIKENYHEIESLMIPISLHDSIDITILKEGNSTFVTCDSFELAGEQFNTVTKVVDILRKRYNFKQHFRIIIYKRIFIAGGLGGGSSDAAAVILAINKMLKLNMSKEDMIEVAREVGSDVPFFLFNKPAIVSGTGEKIDILNSFNKQYYCLVMKPNKGLSTAAVYKKFDELGCECSKTNVSKVIESYHDNEFTLGSEITNDLEVPAISMAPEIQELKDKLINEEGLGCVMMTGSGSTVFALSSNKKVLFKVFEKYFESKNYKIEFCKTL
jgi:4-diphosphocytidyl-2C-methyl-D-erythritol kinase